MKKEMLYGGLIVFIVISLVSGSGRVAIRLINFNNPGGKGANGNCCDGFSIFCHSACDHQFTICLDVIAGSPDISSCRFGRKVTGEVRDRDSFTFGRSIGATPNPLIFLMTSLPAYFRMKVGIWDVDSNNAYDYVDYVASNVALRPGNNAGSAPTQRMTVRRRVTLNVEIKAYCDPGFYGSDCSEFCQDGLLGHYTCNPSTGAKVCNDGWYGYNCDVSVDDCASSPCVNEGLCIDKHKGFLCECPAGYDGRLCERRLDPCLVNPCQHGGVCADNGDSFSCTCADGWSGNDCGSDVNECQSSPCLYGGTCLNLQGNFSCICLKGYTGESCNIELNECASNPCHNGGNCTDDVNGFTCDCQFGYTGSSCENEFDHCESSPCENNATCSSFPDGYQCACTNGYTGSNCDAEIDLCSSRPCLNGATCTNFRTNFTCSCVDGFSGPICKENIDDCSSFPCLNNASCIDGLSEVTCICMEDYTGHFCGTNIDDCTPGVCQNNGSCIDGVGTYSCQCKDNFKGLHCEDVITTSTPTTASTITTSSSTNPSYATTTTHNWTTILSPSTSSSKTTSAVPSASAIPSTSSPTSTPSLDHSISTIDSSKTSSYDQFENDTKAKYVIDATTSTVSLLNVTNSIDYECDNCTVDSATTLASIPTEKAPKTCFPLFVKGKLESRDQKNLDEKIATLLRKYSGVSGDVRVVSELAYFIDEEGGAVTEISINVTIGGQRLRPDDIGELCRSFPIDNFLNDFPYPIYFGAVFPISESSKQAVAEDGTTFTVAMVTVAVVMAIAVIALVAFVIYRKRKEHKFPTMNRFSVDEGTSQFENQLYMQPERLGINNRAYIIE